MPTAPATLRTGVALLTVLILAALGACRSSVRATGSRPSASVAGKVPAAAFFRQPLLSHVTLSPDGEQIAAILARDGREMLIVRPTAGGAVRPLAKLERSRNRASWTVRRVGWGSDERLLVGVEMPSRSATGVRARQTRLMVVDLEGGRIKYLGEDWRYQEYSQFQDDIVSWLPREPNYVLINLWMPEQRGTGVRRLNIINGSLFTVAHARYGTTAWAADHRDRVRAGWGRPRSGTERFLYARVGSDDPFEEIRRCDPFGEDRDECFWFEGFSEDPAVLYVRSSGATGREAIYTYDLTERRMGPLVFGHPDVDVGDLRTSKRDGRLLSIGYVTDEPRLRFFDERTRAEQAAFDEILPGRTNRIVSSDAAERRFVVHSSSDTAAPQYYLFDRDEKSFTFLFSAYPELQEVELSPMRAIRYAARDGLTIHGYLTLPRDAGDDPLPAVVYPHGGPWARDVWGWDLVVQFLASRGFAVLQPNFRGSDGYGSEFERRGHGAWGLEMQDDIADGARWLTAQGIADPNRLGIYGASYGGFAALFALVKEPDLFRAGASFAGVTDILTLLSDDRRYWGLVDTMEELVGDRRDDREALRAISPALNAEKIHVPVLIGHGTEDWRVHVKQAYAMLDALEDAGVEVESHIYDGEVHGFLDERNRIDFYTRLAEFFGRHLAAPTATASANRAR